MWVKNILILGFMLLLSLSCNVASMITDAETSIGNNFAKDLRSGLVSFWKLDESGNTDTRFDSEGVQDLTATGTAVVVTGKYGNAVDCQNSSDNAADGILDNGSPNINISNTSDYTISFWAQDNDGAGGGYAVDFDQTVIRVNSGGGYFEVSTDADTTHSATSVYPVGQWVHFTFVFNGLGDYVDYYVNGSFKESFGVGDSSLVPSQISLCSMSAAGNNFPGYLDSVGLWDRALNSEEIKALANGNNNVD